MDFAATLAEQPQRLAALRAEMDRQGLDGFFVPLADEYMNEYVPAYAQRLAWLTGFTGSAGLAVVLKDRAAVFVDGRYTLQAPREVDGKVYDIRHISKQPVGEFLKSHVKPGGKIGYDSWLHTQGNLDRILAPIAEAQGKLIAVTHNPVDAVWKNRPEPPAAPIVAQPLNYAGESSASKRQRLAADLKKDGLAAAVISSPPSIAWLLNVRGGDVENTPLPLSFCILHADAGADWFVAPQKITAELKSTLDKDIRLHVPENFLPALKALGQKKNKVRVDTRNTAARITDMLQDAGAFIDSGADPCELPKACKNTAEIGGVREVHRRDGLALTRFLAWLSTEGQGKTEMAVQDRLLELRGKDAGFLYPSFPSISGAGPNGAVVHYRATPATNRVLGAGEFYLIDSGGQYQGGTTDVTRTIAIGDVGAAMKRHFTLVLKGHIGLARARFPQGTTGSQLDVLARQHLWHDGLDYDHGTGHGVGAFLGVHEGPQSISSRGHVPLRAGMVISNEPGFYLTGAYGIRIENLVVVQESAVKHEDSALLEFETLTLAPIDLEAVDVSLLNADEKTWLNAYHARVKAAYLSQMQAGEISWLEHATRPV
jgi:Xaa-Pro aminopeptidase